jgi:cytoskeletal protein CcmA (bactofilin family)
MWGKNPEPKSNTPAAKAPEPVAAVPPKPPVAAAPVPPPAPVASTPAPVAAAPSYSAPAPASMTPMSATASRIGPGLKVHGVISGDSDLIVEGETNGKIYLSSARVTVAKSGRVQADIEGLEITIEGSVQGNLKASDRIRLGAASNVQGSLVTPRFAIEDGARLRGKVEMSRPGETPSQTKVADSKPAAKAAEVKAAEVKPAESKPAPEAKAASAIPAATPVPADANARAAAARTQGD